METNTSSKENYAEELKAMMSHLSDDEMLLVFDQLVSESEKEEDKELYNSIYNVLLQKRQKKLLSENVF